MQKNHRILLFIAFALSASPAFAQTLPESATVQEVKKCYEIQEDNLRLSCYDAFAASFQTEIAKGSVVVVDKDDIEEKIDENFGLDKNENDKLREVLKLQPETDADESKNELQIGITEAKKMNNRKFRFYLENGQVWAQTDTAYVYLPKNKENFVLIKKASLGSFQLRVNGKGRSIRVKRVK